MGCDICYTNHAEADQDDMDGLLTLLGVAGCNYIMGVPGADGIMLNYQSTSFHDSHFLRQVLGLRPAPEFEAWLENMRIATEDTRLLPIPPHHPSTRHARSMRVAAQYPHRLPFPGPRGREFAHARLAAFQMGPCRGLQ